MTLRDRMSKLADTVRGLPSRSSVGERTTSVTIRTRTYAGGRRGSDGPKTDVDVVLTPAPKVREVSQRDITGSAGRYTVGDVKVGPITPSYPTGGYTEAQLAPTSSSSGVEVFYVLEGGVTGEYSRVDLSSDRSHSWFLVLRRRRTP